MPKYRKKPLIIEAEQWFIGKEIEGVIYKPMPLSGLYLMPPYIDTLEGRMFVSEGDYIITGIKGEKYPCKSDVFESSYDLVEE